MGNLSDLRAQINEPGFVARLKAIKPEDNSAWTIVLRYVEKSVSVKLLSQPAPRGMAADDVVDKAIEIFLKNLPEFEEKDALSSYIDSLIQTAFSDQSFKNFREYITRFLEAAHNMLSIDQRNRLEQLIRKCPDPHSRTLLIACIRGIQFDVLRDASLWPATRLTLLAIEGFEELYDIVIHSSLPQKTLNTLWSQTRSALIKIEDFEAFLSSLPKKFSQAQTLLLWWQACRDTISLSKSLGDPSETPQLEIPDTAPDPSVLMEQYEMRDLLLEALGALQQHKEEHYLAFMLKFEPIEANEVISDAKIATQIEQKLNINGVTPELVRTWRVRARGFLKAYLKDRGIEF